MSDLRRRYAVLRPTEIMIAWTFIVFPLGLGGVLLFGGPARVSSPSFDALRASPGGVMTWGWAWFLLGVAMLVGHSTPTYSPQRHIIKMFAYIGLSAVAFLFAFAWGVSAIWNPQAGLTGVPAYLGYAMLSASLASSHFVLWRLKITDPDVR